MNPKDRAVLARMHCAIITDDAPVQIDCEMLYTETSPYEVVFMSDQRTEDGKPAEWHYARDLLVEGLTGKYEEGVADHMYGEGDVSVFTKEQFLYTVFRQGDRGIVLAFMKEDIQMFLSETEKVVPLGSEKIREVDIDKAISELLGE